MKVRPSVKPMCEKCKVIKRKGPVLWLFAKTPNTNKDKAKEVHEVIWHVISGIDLPQR